MSELIVIRNPFDRRERDVRPLAPGTTSIEALIGEYLPAGAAEGTELIVSINGQPLARTEWSGRIIEADDQVLVMPVVHGDDGGLLGGLLSLVLMVAAPYMAAFTGITMGTFGLSTSVFMSVMTAGISLIGNALIGALTAPQQPSLPSFRRDSFDSSPSYAWQPVTTQEPGGPIARCYGTFKLHGNIIGGYIRNTGDTGREQEANLLIDLGMGPYADLRDFKVNDQPIVNYSGVTIDTRLGGLNQDVIGAFDDTRLTRTVSAKVVKGAPVTRETEGDRYDALDIVIVFPSGLYYANDSGGLSAISANIKVEISSDNGTTWKVITSSTIAVPRVTKQVGGFTYIRETIIVSEAYSYGVDYLVITGAQQQPIRRTVRADKLTRGTRYQVRVTNLTSDQTSSRYGDDCYLGEIVEILYDDFTYPRTALAAVKAVATNQLSGGIRFSCIADGAIVRLWNGSAWSAAWSNNPAWVCFDILTQPVFDNDLAVVRYDGFDPSRLDLPTFYAWAQWCDAAVPGPTGFEKRCTFDGVFDTQGSMWDAALEVCASARAILVFRGTRIMVVHDAPRSAPAQVFNVANTAVQGFKEVFLPMADRASVIEGEFVNAASDYERDKVTVVETANAEAAAQRVQIASRGIVRASQMWREAKFRLEINRVIRRTAEISVDLDALACTVGDLVWVQNDVPRWGEGGRLGADCTTTRLVLDKPVTLAAGAHEVVVRFADDTIVTRTINTLAGEYSVIDCAALPAAPAQFDLWSIGVRDRAVKPFLVTEVSRDGEQRARLGLIEYNAAVYNVDANNPVLPTPNYSTNAGTPVVSGVTIDEVMGRADDGTIYVHLDVRWDVTGGDRVDVTVNESAYGSSRTKYLRIENVASGQMYHIALRACDYLGRPSPEPVLHDHYVTGKTAPPQTVPWFLIRSKLLSWGIVSDVDLSGYRLRWVAGAVPDWARGQSLHDGLITETPWEMPNVPIGPAVLMIKAIDTSGNESVEPANIVTDLGQPTVANVVETIDLHADGFPGAISNASIVVGDLLANTAYTIWSNDAASPMWSSDATNPMWDLTYYEALTYKDTITVGATEAGAQMTIDYDIDGLGARIEYRRPAGDTAAMWGTESGLTWADDAAPFRVNGPGWRPWPGSLTAEAGDYDIRVRTDFGRAQGRVDALAVRIDVPDIVEYIDDANIAGAGTRLTLARTYRVIRNVNLTLQDDGGSAATARVADKSASLGPLINCFTTAGGATTGRIDAIIQGY